MTVCLGKSTRVVDLKRRTWTYARNYIAIVFVFILVYIKITLILILVGYTQKEGSQKEKINRSVKAIPSVWTT